MWEKQILLGLLGLSAGMGTAAGLFLILGMALGKGIGAIWYFYMRW